MKITRTKIIATIGPACRDPEVLSEMISAGMDVARINCSHSTPEFIESVVADVREISAKMDVPVGILLDLSGPKLRTGKLKDGTPVKLVKGNRFTLTANKIEGDETIVSTSYATLAADVKPGDTILLDDGLIELRVVTTNGTDAECEVITGGVLKNHQGLNIPGVKLSIPALTEKDRADLKVGLKCEVDFVALSFVRDAQDIIDLKDAIGDHWPPVMVIAKLEKPEAVDHLEEILDVTDGVMIARGDLGVELPPERVPPVQKLITSRANAKGKPVITATQMLDSMANNPRPTRAEASDVANAVFEGTDAVMLSEESAMGSYPVETVTMMDRICFAAESSQDRSKLHEHPLRTSAHAIAHAACAMAVDMNARVIAAFTKSGSTARLISQFKPPAPIIALTQLTHVYRQLTLTWGTTPVMLTEVSDSESTLAMVEETLLRHNFVTPQDNIIISGGLPIAARGPANFVKLSTVSPKTPAAFWQLKGI
ncbi:MAG: pyruvate kinase [Candidatus Melainabacteria bacterium]|nr:pyruvate kinase [Candidatus Melainabacteria bacterium]MBX9671797.1 pyruvate kinase [Candidatus Obscuribacterales bacterium]